MADVLSGSPPPKPQYGRFHFWLMTVAIVVGALRGAALPLPVHVVLTVVSVVLTTLGYQAAYKDDPARTSPPPLSGGNG